MTTKFKAGDKVRFKDTPEDQSYRKQHWPLSAKESVFTVAEANAGNGCLYFGACYGDVDNVGAFTSRFELVTETAPKFKAGDKVRIVRRVTAEAGWQNSWVSDVMDKEVGTGRVLTINSVTVYGVTFKEISLGWPPSALELVTETDPKTLKVGDVVRFKDTLSDQNMRRQGYPTSTKDSTFKITYADGSYVKLDGRAISHYRRRFELVKAAPEPAVVGTRPEKLILDEAPPATKGVPLQAHIVVLKTETGLRPASKPFVHVTKKFAEDEAKRLAKENPGQTFVVFSSDNEVIGSEPVVTVTKHATV